MGQAGITASSTRHQALSKVLLQKLKSLVVAGGDDVAGVDNTSERLPSLSSSIPTVPRTCTLPEVIQLIINKIMNHYKKRPDDGNCNSQQMPMQPKAQVQAQQLPPALVVQPQLQVNLLQSQGQPQPQGLDRGELTSLSGRKRQQENPPCDPQSLPLHQLLQQQPQPQPSSIESNRQQEGTRSV